MQGNMKITKAVIPAGGLGIRFLPATKAQPKEMLPIVDKPALQYIIEEAVASGIEDIIIISPINSPSKYAVMGRYILTSRNFQDTWGYTSWY
jgi:UTP-glucose-1-phosphate uridylyltransferase